MFLVVWFVQCVYNEEIGFICMLLIWEYRFLFLFKVWNWNCFNCNMGGILVEKCCYFFDLMWFILSDEFVWIYVLGGQEVNYFDEVYDGK